MRFFECTGKHCVGDIHRKWIGSFGKRAEFPWNFGFKFKRTDAAASFIGIQLWDFISVPSEAVYRWRSTAVCYFTRFNSLGCTLEKSLIFFEFVVKIWFYYSCYYICLTIVVFIFNKSLRKVEKQFKHSMESFKMCTNDLIDRK